MFGYFSKFTQRNEKTGYSTFTVVSGDKTYICHGVSYAYQKLTPLKIEGDIFSEGGIVTHLNITSVRPCDFDKDITSAYIGSGIFANIGDKKAKDLLDKFPNEDIFSVLENETVDEVLESHNIKAGYSHVLNSLKGIVEFNKLLDLLSKQGGDYHVADKFFRVYGQDSVSVVKKNPYALYYCDASYQLCEKLGRLYGIKYYDKKRLKSLILYMMDTNNSRGNTRLLVDDLERQINKFEELSGIGYKTDRVFIYEELLSGDYTVLDENDETYAYKNDDFNQEITIVEHIKRLNTTSCKLKNTCSAEEIEKICGFTYSEEQKRAFSVLETSGVKIITGGPGTGKTTLLRGILTKYELEYPNNKIHLCAPTGSAAKRMQEVTSKKATTIHRMLKLNPFDFSADVENNDADLIVVDESSMIDTFIMSKLLPTVKNGALIIFLGDDNQLPSVRAGNVLFDLLQSGKIESYKLNTVFRQKEGRNRIIDNSKKVITGNKNLLAGDDFILRAFEKEEDMIECAIRLAKHFENKKENYRLFSPVRKRKYLSGTINLNSKLKKEINTDDGSRNCVYYGEYVFSEGDRVIFTKNNYDMKYYNGQEGVIVSIQRVNDEPIIVVRAEDETYSLTRDSFDDLDLGYAITVHKAQGSECDNAIILLPSKPEAMLLRKLLYVSVTRAKSRVILLYEKNALNTAISSYREFPRNTGLLTKLI